LEGGLTDRVSGLVIRAQNGSTDAFEDLVRLHLGVAFAVARAIVPTGPDAEDVVQDAFVRTWQRIGQCREPENFRAWLVSVVRSVALNHRERETRRTSVPLEVAHDLIDGGARTDSGLERREAREHLDRAVNELSETQRSVLLLHDLEGYTHAEIAELLQISNEMSRRYLSDAKRIVRDWLGRDQGGRVG
jgi:RNA polymerase sigma-70 factor (ECF subfamily)